MNKKLRDLYHELYKCPVCGHQHNEELLDKDMLANIAMKSVFGDSCSIVCTNCEQPMHTIQLVPVTTKQTPKTLVTISKLTKGLDEKVHVSEVQTEYHVVKIDDTHHITLAYAQELFSIKHC